MSEGKKRSKWVKKLKLSYLGEIGSSELYRRQSQVIKDPELIESLSAFIGDENRHAQKLADMILESGGRLSRLGGITKGLFSFFGIVTALLGVKVVLLTDIMLERVGIDLYNNAVVLLPKDENTTRYQSEISQMITDEQKHQAWFRQKIKTRKRNIAAMN